MARILAVEDESNLLLAIRRALTKAGHEVTEASTLDQARAALRQSDFDMVLTDVMLGNESGLDLVRELRGTKPADSSGGSPATSGLAPGFDGVIVVMTAYGTVQSAVAAMRDGADDYLQKPLSLEELALQTQRWLDHRTASRRLKLYERLEATKEQSGQILGESPAWKATLNLVDRLARIPLAAPSAEAGSGLPCILLLGETGVGKGVLARQIHARACEYAAAASPAMRAAAGLPPFVHINCSALPATLVEAELFGHEKGAFTDAREARPGLFEMADGGTIFLDEISEMSPELQAKLLLVVEQGTLRRVGGSRERTVRVRVIAASNQDLEARAATGAFRRDLLYRLNAFTIRIPPLRERERDAELIAESLLARLARRAGRSSEAPLTLGIAGRDAIRRHAWPGNVRELVNCVQRAVLLCESAAVEPADLGLVPLATLSSRRAITPPLNGTAAPGTSDLVFDFDNGVHTASEVEKTLILQALHRTGGNVSRAAKLIGMQRSSFRYRIERYHLEEFTKEVARR